MPDREESVDLPFEDRVLEILNDLESELIRKHEETLAFLRAERMQLIEAMNAHAQRHED